MELVRHRVNRLSDLKRLDPRWGAEIDIRSRAGRLILAHEPHQSGDSFAAFLKTYAARHRNRLLILNPKEDGLEDAILLQVKKQQIKNFFFLDLTVPTAVRLARRGEKRFAVRVSEYEPVESALAFRGLAQWVWLDCFSGKPSSPAKVRSLQKYFRVCLVSPELEGYATGRIAAFRPLAAVADAVCTKHVERWL